MANALQGARRPEGDARRHLHGDGPRARGRDARVHAPRRPAHRRLRRVLGRLALGPDGRHGLRGAGHAGRGLAARQDRPAQARPRTRRWRMRRACTRASSSGARATTCRCGPGRDRWLHELDVSDDPASCACEPMDSEDLLFLMYTSGTTAKPKGIAHTTGGYLVGVSTTHHYIFDLKPETDVYWCAADIGWITGHSYIVYGPLCNATTSVLYEGTPDFPDHDALVVDRRALRRDDPLHGADGDPGAHEVGARARGGARPLVAAPARLGRRADQPRGVDLVPRAHRRRPLPRSSTRGGRRRRG